MPSRPQSRWTEERILPAFHDWTRDTGEPPRSYEWSPATARSLGGYNERAARWERDWPRWPGSDTVRYHFGRFTQRSRPRGFQPRPLVFEMSLPERVDADRRLAAAGEPTVVIADHLCVHPATVRNPPRATPTATAARRSSRMPSAACAARSLAGGSAPGPGDRRRAARLDAGRARPPPFRVRIALT
jgi:hypothetical protein